MPPAMRREFEAQNKELIDAILLMRGHKRNTRRLSAGSTDSAHQNRFGNNNGFNLKCDIL